MVPGGTIISYSSRVTNEVYGFKEMKFVSQLIAVIVVNIDVLMLNLFF